MEIWVIIFALLSYGLTAGEFKLRLVIEQEKIFHTEATTKNGEFSALSYRIPDLEKQDGSIIGCISVWNKNTDLELIVEEDIYLIEINTPAFDSDWPNHTYCSRAGTKFIEIKACQYAYASCSISNKFPKDIFTDSNEKRIQKLIKAELKTLMEVSLYGGFSAMVTESEIKVKNITTGNIFQKIPTLTEEFGFPVLVFFFEYQGVLHLSVVYANHVKIWCICKQNTKSTRNTLPVP
jgi:hypothetical protein